MLIFIDDKSRIHIEPKTEVIVEGRRDAQSNISKRVSMEIGRLFAKVDQQRGSLQIATPTSVASVKGTAFWVAVLADGTTQVLTLEGLVELVNRMSGKIVEIRPGQQGESNPQGEIATRDVPADEMPEEPDRDSIPKQTIEIEVQDAGGQVRTIIIEIGK